MNIAVIVATPAEAEGLRDLGFTVFVSGVGAVNAALATHEALAQGALAYGVPSRERPDLVVSAGIGGAYPNSGLSVGDVAVSSEMIYAGLGAVGSAVDSNQHASDQQTSNKYFLDLEDLGLPLLPGVFNRLPAWAGARAWAARVSAAHGPMLTLETVTGSRETALALERRYPGALAEGMEGAGVAHAAYRLGVPAVEVRGISNMVGPRDRASWRVADAVRAYREALASLPLS